MNVNSIKELDQTKRGHRGFGSTDNLTIRWSHRACDDLTKTKPDVFAEDDETKNIFAILMTLTVEVLEKLEDKNWKACDYYWGEDGIVLTWHENNQASVIVVGQSTIDIIIYRRIEGQQGAKPCMHSQLPISTDPTIVVHRFTELSMKSNVNSSS